MEKWLRILMVCIGCGQALSLSAQVKISDTGTPSAPHAAAMLDLESSNKGMLIPRVALTSLTSWLPLTGTATEGMVVYNTNENLRTGDFLQSKGLYQWTTGIGWESMLTNQELSTIQTDINNRVNTIAAAITTQRQPVPANITEKYPVVRGADGIDYWTVKAKDGRIWTMQNLGAVDTATSFTDTNPFVLGDLYQWGRWADGHQKRNSNSVLITPSPNDPRGAKNFSAFIIYDWWQNGPYSWTAPSIAAAGQYNSCDPCKQLLGNNFRLPTYNEYDAMMTAEGLKTSGANPFNSSLRIHGSGYREYYLMQMQVRGLYTNASYWTSDHNINYSGSSGLAGLAQFYSNGNNAVRGISEHSLGMSIRCIQDP